MNENQQKGYDAWIDYWTKYDSMPTARDCPARWMHEGEERYNFISGWVKAKREFMGE